MSLTKLKKLKISSKKQTPWNEGYFNVSTPDKVAETIGHSKHPARVDFCEKYKIPKKAWEFLKQRIPFWSRII